MSFSMKFTVPENLSFRSDEMNDDAPTSPYSVVLDACEQLDEGGCGFEILGFGLQWTTDVSYDLGIVLDTFPSVIAALEEGSATELDFASQGLERRIYLQPKGDSVELRVESTGSRALVDGGQDVELVSKMELIESLTAICMQVSKAIDLVNPALGSLPPMPDWRNGVVRPLP